MTVAAYPVTTVTLASLADLPPSPEWAIRQNAGIGSNGRRGMCCRCQRNLDGVERFGVHTMRSPKSISFAHYHVGCLPPDAAPVFEPIYLIAPAQ